MSILIVGNMGYIGPAVADEIRRNCADAAIIGYDSGYFAHCLTSDHLPETALSAQIFGDVRALPEDLPHADAVIYLAAISNDPMGARFEQATLEINRDAALDLARQAAARGTKHFVFASSCSLYGFAEGDARCEEDQLNPLTAYARSKAGAEEGLRVLAEETGLRVTALRFATACGYSPRTRLDLVLNDLVASALTAGRIDVLSDGSPWRPLIHVRDMARAIAWALGRQDGPDFMAVNAGADGWNYQVIELAEAVRRHVGGTGISINPDAQPDKRSYRVNFARFAAEAPTHQPLETLDGAIAELANELDRWLTHRKDYRKSDLIRFNVLDAALRRGALTADLRR